MALIPLATLLAPARTDPNAYVWLFYLGFLLLVGGCCAYGAALFSFGGVARNFGALVAVGLYMLLTGVAFVAAVWIWGLQDQQVRDNNAFLGVYFAGLAVMIVGAALVVFSRLLPTSARVPLPDILTPGLFGLLGFVPTLVVAFLLASLNAALDQLSPIGPVLILVVLTLLVVLLRRGVHAPLNVKLLAVGAAAVVTLALFLRGPSNWSEPPIWGFDILLLALAGSAIVYFVSRNLTARDEAPPEAPAPTSAEPPPQQAASTAVIWEEPPTGD